MEGRLLKLIILQLNNNTFQASIQESNSSQLHLLQGIEREYDHQGAIYYVVVVLCIYAFSIILLIGSSIKKSKQDKDVTKYVKGMEKLRWMERRQQKFKARMMFHNNKQLAELLERRSSERSCRGSIDFINISPYSNECHPDQKYYSISKSAVTLESINEKKAEESIENTLQSEKDTVQMSTRKSTTTAAVINECSEITFV